MRSIANLKRPVFLEQAKLTLRIPLRNPLFLKPLPHSRYKKSDRRNSYRFFLFYASAVSFAATSSKIG